MRLRHVSSCAAAAAALVLGSTAAHAVELRSDEGVAITVPDGWERQTKALGVTTALKLERTEAAAGSPHATIVINILGGVQAMSEEKAFTQTRDLLGKSGDVVARANGNFLRIDFDYPVEGQKLKARLYAALREKRLFYFIMTTTAEAFDRDGPVVDQVVEGASFFAPVAKVAEKPAAEKPPVEKLMPPQASPISTLTQPEARLSKEAPAVRPATAPEPESDGAIPAAESVGPGRTPAAPAAPGVAAKPGPALPDAAKPVTPELAKAEVAPLATPVAPEPTTVRRTTKENILLAPTLVASDDQYDSDHRAAKNLVDPGTPNGWCSSPTSRVPHRFVFELAHTTDLGRVAFDDTCPEEPGFEDAAARDIMVEGSTTGPRGPWRLLGSLSLKSGKNDQGLDLPPNEVRWLRVGILSNQNHPTLTRLMKIRAFAAEVVPVAPPAPVEARPVATDEGPFRLERLRVSKERLGAALDPAVFHEGETFWIYFKPRALRLSAKGEYSIEVDLKIEDAEGVEKLDSPRVLAHTGKPPAAPYSPFVTVKVELPGTFPAGAYAVLLTVHDKEAGTDVHERLAFRVGKR